MRVSVVIPARDAAETLASTLDSLLAQTHPAWEAIVVDDGSTDATARIARDYGARDERIRTVSQPGSGMGAARNTGLAQARFEWLLFLDADDWITPPALATFAAAAQSDEAVDAAYCRWARVAPGGAVVEEPAPVEAAEFFPTTARFCPIPIHACVVRRGLVEELGGFDPRQRLCADWDIWQRLARRGARFHPVPEVLALYRMRPGHAVSDPRAILLEGLEIIDRGHGRDPRVSQPQPDYAEGIPASERSGARLLYCCWNAGVAIGSGADARPLLDAVRDDHDPDLSPAEVAQQLFRSAPLPGCRTPDAWGELWPRFEGALDQFLGSLESQAGARGLAGRARRTLERLALGAVRRHWPCTIGRRHAIEVELTRPIRDVASTADWLDCAATIEGEELGLLELPICDGRVPRSVLADALAGRFAWPLLGRFFERTLYPSLEVKEDGSGASVWRGDLCLATWSSDERERRPLHDAVGWTVFLQELWGRPDWRTDDFYDPKEDGHRKSARRVGKRAVVDVADDLVDLEVAGSAADVLFSVGGAPTAWLRVDAPEGRIGASQLVAKLTAAAGYELCCVAVREGFVGQPLEGAPLRFRLARAARAKRGPTGGGGRVRRPDDVELGPGWTSAVRAAAAGRRRAVVFARHAAPHPATSASRRAVLPSSAAPELLAAADAAGEPFIRVQEGGPGERLFYAPDVFWRPRNGVEPVTIGLPAATSEELAGEGQPPKSGRPETLTYHLPILMYHQVAPAGAAAFARYRVAPEAFEEQLRYLRDAGFRGVTLDEWREAMQRSEPLEGRAVLLTFDDGFLDFGQYAWPLLRHYGFPAIVFLVADRMGATNSWDEPEEPLALLAWEDVRRLQDEGCLFGSHSASHPFLTALSPAEVAREAARSRAVLTRGLGRPVIAFAYPHGAEDEAVQHLVGACGYVYGLSCRPGPSRLGDPLLALPRVEVTGRDTLGDFIAKLGE